MDMKINYCTGDVKKQTKKDISKHIYIDYVALFSPVRNECK